MTQTVLPAFKKSGVLTGVDDGSNPFPVKVTASDITVETGPEVATAPTDRSGSITVGGTAQQAMAANTARVEAFVQNIDTTNLEDLWINITGGTAAANTAGSYRLPTGTGWSGKVTSAISVVAATTGHKFSAGER